MSKLPQFLLQESKKRVSDDSFYEDSQVQSIPKDISEPQNNKPKKSELMEISEKEEFVIYHEPVKHREYSSIDDNMTPYLCDILAELDRDINDTECVFKEYVNGIIEDTTVILTRSSEFESALVKAVTLYEEQASELILDIIEKYNLPTKLMKLNQLKLRNKVFIEEIVNSQPLNKHPDNKACDKYLQSCLYETGIEKAKNDNIFNSENKIEAIPFLTDSTVKSIEETNKILAQILEDEMKIQSQIFKN